MPNQIKTCPHRGNMKILLVLVCSVMSWAHGSLEPAGYKPPGTYAQTRYLPPSSPGNHHTNNRYISPSPNLPGQNLEAFAKELSTSFSLPLQNEPLPFSNYLPANRQSSDTNNHQSTLGNPWRNVMPFYQPSREIQPSFTDSIPQDNYLPVKNELSSSELHPPIPDKSYLASNTQSAQHLPSSFSSHRDHSSYDQQSRIDQTYQQSIIDDFETDKLPSRADHRNSATSGYQYSSSENQRPAKYEFEYEVKDNYGNDYGHKEARNGENTQGVYKVLLPDGRRQVVHYEADSHGYRPIITYEQVDTSSYSRQSTAHHNPGYQY